MSNADDFFLKQMKGVSPIKKNNKVEKKNSTDKHSFKKKNITKQTKKILNAPAETNKKIKTPQFHLEKIDLKKNIKKRSFNIDKKIDFHGKTLLESEEVFASTILKCYNNNLRLLLFVTGKGLFKSVNSENLNKPKLYHGVIRSSFIKWVKLTKFSKYILSFEQASLSHGGDGAFYVYLRKKKN